MNERRAAVVAWFGWGLVVTGFAVHLIPGRLFENAGGGTGPATLVVFGAFLLSFATVGSLVASRRPRNPIGWLLLGAGLSYVLAGFATSLNAGTTGLAAPALHLVGQPLYFGGVALGFLTILLFPTGSLPSRRWRWVGRLIVVGWAVFTVGQTFGPATVSDIHARNPLAVGGSAGRFLTSLQGAAGGFTIVGGILAVFSLIVRFRRAGGVERKQIEWLAYAGVLVLLGMVSSIVLESLPQTPAITNAANGIGTAALACIPMAMGIAILRRRLYDIDVVINKTVVFTLLAAFITAVYVGVVVGAGAAIGERGGRPNLAPSIVATAVVALGFGPVKERVQHLANRMVYGRRASPYEALSAFAERMGGAVAADELLPTTVRILAEGTGASGATVWILSNGTFVPGATWPDDAIRPEAVAVRGPGVGSFPDATLALPVQDGGETLGAVTLQKPRGERLAPLEEALARDLASQAGLVLRNVRLTQELLDRMEEIRASRARIVAAQDGERRRLERNIHDGAQQELVALAVRLRMARALLDRDAERAERALRDVESGARGALETLRDLARGIYPSRLAEGGLAAALAEQAGKAALPVEVDAVGVGRYAPEAEAAAYFCCLEALQNVAKYAGATRAVIQLRERDGELVFSVSDDGRGFDAATVASGTGLQGMSDRVSALSGTVDVRSTPGAGTTVTGRLPVRVPVAAGAAST